jgi:hypothetical protein
MSRQSATGKDETEYSDCAIKVQTRHVFHHWNDAEDDKSC